MPLRRRITGMSAPSRERPSRRRLGRGSDAPREPLLRWRIERLRGAGFPTRLAERVTRDPGYDLHALLELTDRGCPAELAVRILAPLHEEGGSC
jgi:hypothetical protein